MQVELALRLGLDDRRFGAGRTVFGLRIVGTGVEVVGRDRRTGSDWFVGVRLGSDWIGRGWVTVAELVGFCDGLFDDCYKVGKEGGKVRETQLNGSMGLESN